MDKIYELEKDLEKDAGDFAKKLGYWHRKYAHPHRRAAPDREFHKPGSHFYVEFKRRPNEPTAQQFAEHRDMRAAGCDVFWVDSIEDFRAVLKSRECGC